MKWIDKIVDGMLATLLAGTVLIVTLGVFFRYVLNNSLGWTDEIGSYALGWISFLGAYSCFRKKSHLNFDLLQEALSPSLRQLIIWLTGAMLSIFFLAMAWYSFQIIMVVGGSYIRSLDIPRGVFLGVLPISFILMTIAVASGFSIRRRD
ncbi:MAG: TRAP transporter small permease [Thermodesulfobacteriota bacterium]